MKYLSCNAQCGWDFEDKFLCRINTPIFRMWNVSAQKKYYIRPIFRIWNVSAQKKNYIRFGSKSRKLYLQKI